MGHVKRYWKGYLREHRHNLLRIFLLMAVTGIFSLVIGLYGKIMVDSVIQPVVESGAPPQWHLFGLLACLYAVTRIVYAAAYYGQNRLSASILLKVTVKYRFQLSEKLNALQMTFYDTHQTGKLTARLFSDVGMIQGSSQQLITALVSCTSILAISLCIMSYLNWKLALLTVAVLPLYGLTYEFFKGAIRRRTESIRERNSRMWALGHERIAGIQVVKCFNRETSEVLAFFRLAKQQLREIVRRIVLNASMTTLCALLYYGGFVAVVWLGVRMLEAKAWKPGEFLWFNTLCLLNFPALRDVVGVATPWRELRTNLRRVFEILDEPVTIKDPKPGIILGRVKGRVEFLNVTLRYPGQPAASLSDINLTIPTGTKVSLVGRSGAGKSTLALLLQRLYDPTEGYILLDGHNLRDITLKSLREQVVRVSQEAVIFSGTIAQNIRYGRLDATNKQVMEAAGAAELHDFILSLPEKYETELGEMGINLSGGQKQRLALARALVTDPAILILDDTTSALDAETSAKVEETLERILEGRTAFIITHRLTTAMKADIILVMENGRITEMGPHADLMENGGLYRRIYDQQIGRYGEL